MIPKRIPSKNNVWPLSKYPSSKVKTSVIKKCIIFDEQHFFLAGASLIDIWISVLIIDISQPRYERNIEQRCVKVRGALSRCNKFLQREIQL